MQTYLRLDFQFTHKSINNLVALSYRNLVRFATCLDACVCDVFPQHKRQLGFQNYMGRLRFPRYLCLFDLACSP